MATSCYVWILVVMATAAGADHEEKFCQLSGALHYRTFDGLFMAFQGQCQYQLAAFSGGRHLPLNISLTAQPHPGKDQFAVIQTIHVTVGDTVVDLEHMGDVYVNGQLVTLPHSTDDLRIAYNGMFRRIETTSGVTVEYDGRQTAQVALGTLGVPPYPSVRGLCGNGDGDPASDLRLRDGTDVRGVWPPHKREGRVGDSWQLNGTTQCDARDNPAYPHCSIQNDYLLRGPQYCGLFYDRLGVMAPCINAGHFGPYIFEAFDACRYDVCTHQGNITNMKVAACEALTAFALRCATAGHWVNWRGAAQCVLECLPGREYQPGAVACPPSCAAPNAARDCKLPRTESCVCSNGTILDGHRCVRPQECGCLLPDGVRKQIGDSWRADDCSHTYTCEVCTKCAFPVGHVVARPSACGPRHMCSFVKGQPKCVPKGSVCGGWGDVHFVTFDGVSYTYQGVCKYVMASSPGGADDNATAFTVYLKAHHRGVWQKASVPKYYELVANGHVIRIDQGPTVFVDGKELGVPLMLPGVKVVYNGKFVRAETDSGVAVEFDGVYTGRVLVPGAYHNTTSGLCGVYDDLPENDLVRNGTDYLDDVVGWGDGWQVDVTGGEDATCGPVAPTPVCPIATKQVAASNTYCGHIADRNGPFAACIRKLTQDSQNMLHACVFDVCVAAPSAKVMKRMACADTAAFADVCAKHGFGSATWRSVTKCSQPCPAGLVYHALGSACPASCVTPRAPDTCPYPDTEVCLCPAGQLLLDGACVRPEDCGCALPTGDRHQVGDTWLSADCTSRYTCEGCHTCVPHVPRLTQKDFRCPAQQMCATVGTSATCRPRDPTCTLWGGQHVLSFDGLISPFAGPCKYVMVAAPDGTPGAPPFRVLLRNERRLGNHQNVYVRYVEVEAYGEIVRLGQEVTIGGTVFYAPSKTAEFTLEQHGPFLRLTTKDGLVVQYDQALTVTVTLPRAYRGRVGGLCGDADGDPDTDDRTQGNCDVGDHPDKFGMIAKSWQVVDPEETRCGKPPSPSCSLVTDELVTRPAYCGLLKDTRGPYSTCISHPEGHFSAYYRACRRDVCAHQDNTTAMDTVACAARMAFAAHCEGLGISIIATQPLPEKVALSTAIPTPAPMLRRSTTPMTTATMSSTTKKRAIKTGSHRDNEVN